MAASRNFTPRRIKAPHGAKVFEITWADDVTSAIPHEVLRGYCPCATCQGHSGSVSYVPHGNLELRTIERVGNYALSLGWGDGHDSGIYSFEYLRHLGDRVATEGVEALTAIGPKATDPSTDS
jgi:DUF971 family protein